MVNIKDIITCSVWIDHDGDGGDKVSISPEYGGSIPISDLFQNYNGKKVKITIEQLDY